MELKEDYINLLIEYNKLEQEHIALLKEHLDLYKNINKTLKQDSDIIQLFVK